MPNYESGSFGIELLDLERLRAIEKGYTTEHDLVQHTPDELLRIGACYLEAAASDMEGADYDWPHPFWPEDSMIPPERPDTPLEMAVRGGQFIVAAIDAIYAQAGQTRN